MGDQTQAQVHARECRNGALHRAQLPSTWNGPRLLLLLLNLHPFHLLLPHHPPRPRPQLLVLGRPLSPPLKQQLLLLEEERPQQQKNQQLQQKKQQQLPQQPQPQPQPQQPQQQPQPRPQQQQPQ